MIRHLLSPMKDYFKSNTVKEPSPLSLARGNRAVTNDATQTDEEISEAVDGILSSTTSSN